MEVAEKTWGSAPFESADGESIYYTSGSGCGPLFVRPLAGGPEKIVVEPVCYRAFAVTSSGIYYISGSTEDPRFTVRLLDPVTGKSTVLGESDGRYLGQGLTVSPDGKTILLSASMQTGADLYLVDNFR
jgi:Tol biopolymer transport system component